MKPRHAAALALVGWYMLGPPIGADNLLKLNSPLSAWEQLGTYDTVRECQEWLTALQKHPFSDAVVRGIQRDSHYTTLNPQQYKVRLYASSCVEADDPRLKKK
jgi:hypothetical protein